MDTGAKITSPPADIVSEMQDTMRACVDHAVEGLSEMVGATYEVVTFETRCASLLLLPGFVADPEIDAVGIYLKAVGSVGGQLLMVMPFSMAMDMVERMTGERVEALGRLEMSALGEAGNLMSGYFLKVLEENSQISARPTPPLFLVDMLGTIMEAVVVSSPELAGEQRLTHAAFQIPGTVDRADFWVAFADAEPCRCESMTE